MIGVFPSVLKTAELVPVLKKDSKLDYSHYRPISQLSKFKKYLKNVCVKDCIPSSKTIMLSMTYNFDSDNNILNAINVKNAKLTIF